jgi:hypothetical protein
MMSRYSQDDKKDIFQLQDMGTDAGGELLYGTVMSSAKKEC